MSIFPSPLWDMQSAFFLIYAQVLPRQSRNGEDESGNLQNDIDHGCREEDKPERCEQTQALDRQVFEEFAHGSHVFPERLASGRREAQVRGGAFSLESLFNFEVAGLFQFAQV